MKWPVTPIRVSTLIVTSRRLRWWWVRRELVDSGIAINGTAIRAATRTATAAAVIAATASRQPHS